MTISGDVIEAARSVAASSRMAAEVLLAVAIVETGARAFARIGPAPVSGHADAVVQIAGGERREPLIRFEGHYFDRLLSGDKRRAAREAGLSHPRAGAVRNPASQAARWALLERAARLDAPAAFASVSWGLAQVMGAHWQALGYAGPEDLAAAARRSAEGQFEIAARFLRLGRLDRLLLAGDHAGFARRYNGPFYLRNRYDAKIAEALGRAHRLLGTAPALRRGARGPQVTALQRALQAAGLALAADGILGPATEAAVRAYQTREGLAADGLAGPATLGRLGLS